MLSILFIVARELLEAVLIVSVIWAFLKQQNLVQRGRNYLVLGILGGLSLSVLLAMLLSRLSDWLEGRALLYFEAGIFIFSAVLMTQMVFWMRKVGAKLKGQIEGDLKNSLTNSGFWGITLVTALGLGREGAELATYIYSLSLSEQFSSVNLALACVLGIVLAIGFYILLSRGMSRLNLKTFFALTSLFLFASSGALIIEASIRLSELDILPPLVPVLWNSSHLIPAHSGLGQVLGLVLGYKPTPSLMMVLLYLAYWAFVISFYYRPWHRSKLAGSSQSI